MNKDQFFIVRAIFLCLTLLLPGLAWTTPSVSEFALVAEKKYGLDPHWVAQQLSLAEKKQAIIDTMNRPAEGKPWYKYRPIFVTEKRIREGVEYWRGHKKEVANAAQRFGVPAHVLVAIVGVETSYGKIMGNYRVLDSLFTLGFYYPKRGEFFRKELMEYLKLSQEQDFSPIEKLGSYAGAMGFGQFMPSSYRAYAVDGDGDGQTDLWQSTDDILGSVAHYLSRHHWRTGAPVIAPISHVPDKVAAEKHPLKPNRTVLEWLRLGVRPSGPQEDTLQAALVQLETKQGEKSAWFGFQNFYVITRYNHSPKYAMAVIQLAAEIRTLKLRGAQ